MEISNSSPFNKNLVISDEDIMQQSDLSLIPSFNLETLQGLQASYSNMSNLPAASKLLVFNFDEASAEHPVINLRDVSPEEAAAANPENLAVMNEKQDRIDLSNGVQEKIKNRPYVVKYNGQVRDNIAINFVDSKRFVLLVRIAVINFILRSTLQKKSQQEEEERKRQQEELQRELHKQSLAGNGAQDQDRSLEKKLEQQPARHGDKVKSAEREEEAAEADRTEMHRVKEEKELQDEQYRTIKQKEREREQDEDDVLQRTQRDQFSKDEEGIT